MIVTETNSSVNNIYILRPTSEGADRHLKLFKFDPQGNFQQSTDLGINTLRGKNIISAAYNSVMNYGFFVYAHQTGYPDFNESIKAVVYQNGTWYTNSNQGYTVFDLPEARLDPGNDCYLSNAVISAAI